MRLDRRDRVAGALELAHGDVVGDVAVRVSFEQRGCLFVREPGRIVRGAGEGGEDGVLGEQLARVRGRAA